MLYQTVERLGVLLERQSGREESVGAGAVHDRFMRQHPPTFDGRGDSEAAEDWVFKIQEIFRAIGVPPERMVGLATYVLGGDASSWWRTTSAVVFAGRDDVSWEDFLGEFNEQYFPEHVRDGKREEFMSLEQGEMSLAVYTRKFNALERYCPEICVTPVQRARKFIRGLRKQLRTRVTYSMPQTLADAVKFATLIDQDYQEHYVEAGKTQGKTRGRDDVSAGGSQSKRPRTEESDARQSVGSSSRRPEVCRDCSRIHPGRPCFFRSGACLGCGQLGHFVRECPNRQGEPSRRPGPSEAGRGIVSQPIARPEQGRPAGRVYSIQAEEAKDGSN